MNIVSLSFVVNINEVSTICSKNLMVVCWTNISELGCKCNIVIPCKIVGIELNHPDDLGSFDYKLHKNLVTFILESDNVEDLELPCTLDVLNPWNKHLTTLTLFSDETKNEELLTDENKVCINQS